MVFMARTTMVSRYCNMVYLIMVSRYFSTVCSNIVYCNMVTWLDIISSSCNMVYCNSSYRGLVVLLYRLSCLISWFIIVLLVRCLLVLGKSMLCLRVVFFVVNLGGGPRVYLLLRLCPLLLLWRRVLLLIVT